MIKQIKKVGNGNALFLDKAILELVGLKEGGEVQITVHDGTIVVTPTHPRPVDKKRFEAALNRVITEYGDVLRKLAE